MRWLAVCLLMVALPGVASQNGTGDEPPVDTAPDDPDEAWWAEPEVRIGTSAVALVVLLAAFVVVSRR